MSTIGVVGLGRMGLPMVRELITAGRQVFVCSRSPGPVEQAVAAGATACATPGELARNVEVVVTALPADPEVLSVLLDGGVLEALAPGGLVIDTSTTSPDTARIIHAAASARGVSFVDAPVSGGPIGVEQHTLAVMAGGTIEPLDRARVALAPFTGRFVVCGGPGAGQVAKACNQLVVVATLEVVAEMLVLASAAGADVEAVREVLMGGYAASRILELHGRRMIDRDFVPGGTVRTQLKDVGIIRQLAAAAGVADLPAFEAAARHIEALAERGDGGLDHSAIVQAVESRNGARVGRS